MIKFQGKLKFLQYIKNKPVRWGIKVYLICEADSGYCLGSVVYTGKNTIESLNYFSGTESIVLHLCEDYLSKGRILYLDNFFSTVNLVNYLHSKQTAVEATLR